MGETMKNPLRYEPDYAVMPGETLAEKLDELDMNQRELAMRLEMSHKCVNQIIRGKAAISHATAIKLERVTGIPSHVWNNLEMNYRAALARIKDLEQSGTAEDLQWLKTIPTRELMRRKVIHETRDKKQLLQEVFEFFGVANREAWQDVWGKAREAAAWRKSVCFESHLGPTATWLRLGELAAQSIECGPFSGQCFRKMLEEIRKLTTSEPQVFQPRMQELCSRAGVAVAFVPELKGCPASGATRWLSPGKAMIQLSLRYKTDDHFWFSFFHEAGHVLNDRKEGITLDEKNQQNDEQEARANRFAANILIPPANAPTLKCLRTEADVKRFAAQLGISPGIVVGRLQHDELRTHYQLNHLKIRLQWQTD